MSTLAICSRKCAGAGRAAFLGLVWAQALTAPALCAQVRLTQQEALRLAFPAPLTIERKTAFLDEEQIRRARELAGPDVSIEQRVVTYYVGSDGTVPIGVAYFDAHRVRTLPEVLMVVVSPEARIERIEVLKFSEPPEYLAPEGWRDQFEGRGLTNDLSLKGSIINITGASLTSRAITRASRRVLALHEVIRPIRGETAREGRR
jgi:hypothetical protein